MRTIFAAGVTLVAACGGGTGTTDADVDVDIDASTVDAGPTVDADPGACAGPTPALHATFTFDVYGGGASAFSAQIEDLPYPDTGLVEVVDGACRYVRPGAPFCDPACTDGWCGLDEACHPYPTGLAAGTLTTTGTHPPLTLAPGMFPGSYYPPRGVPSGWLVPGEIVGAMVPGDDAPAIAGEVAVVAPLELPSSQLTATEHEPLTVAWTPAPAGQGGEVVVHFDNDHHGINSYLECVVADAAGQVTIPTSVLDPLIADGATGIGTYIENAYVLRRQRTVLPTPLGCAAVQSTSSTWVLVDTVRAE